jgi:hypothetical protein
VRNESGGLEQQPSERTPQGRTTIAGVRHSAVESQSDRGQLSFAARIQLSADADGEETRQPEGKQAASESIRAKATAPRPAAPAVPPLRPRVETAPEQRALRAMEEPANAESRSRGPEKSRGGGELSPSVAQGSEETVAHSRTITSKAVPVLPTSATGNAVQSALEPRPTLRPEAPRVAVAEPTSDAPIKAPVAREIQLSVSDGDQGDIHLKLLERGGKVHVAVRSPQPELASKMQQDVGKLVSRLQSEIGHTESWTPGKEVSAGFGEAERGSSAGTGESYGNQESEDADDGESRRRRDEQDRPEWVNELLGEEKNEKKFQEEVLQWLKAYRG